MGNCYTCELVRRRDEGKAPLWDCIYRTVHWDVVHSYHTGLRGWLVLVARRHIASLSEMTAEEAVELGQLQRKVSIALEQVTGCEKTYVMQFAESPEHPHVHFHIVPRMADQPDDRKATKSMEYLKVPDEECVSDADMDALAEKVRQVLISMEEN